MNSQKKLLSQTLCLLLLFSCSSSFAMLHRRYQKQLARVEELKKIKEMTSLSEIDAQIEAMKQEPYEECLKELAKITGISYEIVRIKIDFERMLVEEMIKKEK